MAEVNKTIVYEKSDPTVDIHKIIDDAMEKRDRYVTVFVSVAGTSVYVYPYEKEDTSWKLIKDPVTGKQQSLCGNCHRVASQSYPYCPWCGEQLGQDIHDVADALEKARINAKKRSLRRKFTGEDKNDQT